MKPILFIFRSFNDLDHMLPIVDHALNNNRSIILTCINSEFDMKDFRIQYLKNKFSFCTEYIYQLGYKIDTVLSKIITQLDTLLDEDFDPNKVTCSVDNKEVDCDTWEDK